MLGYIGPAYFLGGCGGYAGWGCCGGCGGWGWF
jgi:hypothetical protein